MNVRCDGRVALSPENQSSSFSLPPFCLFHTAYMLEITNSSGSGGAAGVSGSLASRRHLGWLALTESPPSLAPHLTAYYRAIIELPAK